MGIGVGAGASGQGEAEAETITVQTTVAAGTITETTTTETEVTVTKTVTTTKIEVKLKPPPTSGVKVNYGEWAGLFKIYGAHVTSTGSFGIVRGQFEYLGGGDCPLGYVEVSGTFFDRSGRIVGTGLWNSTTAPKAARLPMEVSGPVSGTPTRAEIVVTGATCK